MYIQICITEQLQQAINESKRTMKQLRAVTLNEQSGGGGDILDNTNNNNSMYHNTSYTVGGGGEEHREDCVSTGKGDGREGGTCEERDAMSTGTSTVRSGQPPPECRTFADADYDVESAW